MGKSSFHKHPGQGFWARAGDMAGKSLAEAIPKETERLRLAQGLKDLSNKKDLDPFQQFAELSSLPGVTPQMIQSGSELLKQRTLKDAYGRKRNGEGAGVRENNGNSQNLPPDLQNETNNPSFADLQNPNSNAPRNPKNTQLGVVDKNALRPEALPQGPWSPEKRDDRTFEYMGLGYTPEQAQAKAADDEQRELSVSPTQRARDEYLKGVQTEMRDKFKKDLELKLEKADKAVFGDITGENIAKIQKLMERDLRLNPRQTVDQVVDYWTTKALDLAKDKKKLDTMKSDGTINRLNHTKENLTRLEHFSKRYKETGNSEEFFNTLKSGFGMSAPGAATIAYPMSKGIKEYTNNLKQKNHRSPERISSAKYADDIANILNSDDSLLTIARELKRKDPFFNVHEFFEYFKDNQDTLRLTPLQKRDLGESPEDIIPNWSDLTILPWR